MRLDGRGRRDVSLSAGRTPRSQLIGEKGPRTCGQGVRCVIGPGPSSPLKCKNHPGAEFSPYRASSLNPQNRIRAPSPDKAGQKPRFEVRNIFQNGRLCNRWSAYGSGRLQKIGKSESDQRTAAWLLPIIPGCVRTARLRPSVIPFFV